MLDSVSVSPSKKGNDRFEPVRAISVRGAREHNLKNVDVDIPRDRLVVITGLSGSGKSSLAFDTIFAEGQRKYMESLSAYARQFLDQLKKPAVDKLEGLPPTIAIEQRAAAQNPRSTVATSTEIYDYLRLLFARIGQPTCWYPTEVKRNGLIKGRCGRPIEASNPAGITRVLDALPQGTKLLVLAPMVRGRKGYHREVLEELLREGYARARINGSIVRLEDVLAQDGDNPAGLGRYQKHHIEAVVDRLVVKKGTEGRLRSSVESALATGSGTMILSTEKDKSWIDTTYSEHWACAEHPEASLDELEPRLFSFNAHQGACETCHGLGVILEIDEELIVPDAEKLLNNDGILPWKRTGPAGMIARRHIRIFCERFGVRPATPMGKLKPKVYQILLRGEESEEAGAWPGAIPLLQDWFTRTESDWAREYLTGFMAERTCPRCHGDRLHEKALSVFCSITTPLPQNVVEARKAHHLDPNPLRLNIADFVRLNIGDALQILDNLELGTETRAIAEPIVDEVRARLGFLTSVGLEYLSLSRRMSTLSGGEAQRIRLATQVGSGIVGAAYVLDEPTIGLHPRDNTRLIRTLRHLADIGNTVLVVEHDEEMIRAADYVLDMGPGPGVHGGMVVAQGTIDEICKVEGSLTGKYLSGKQVVPIPNERRAVSAKRSLIIKNAQENNLKGIDVTFPLGGLVVVTGVSGSGKSTLVNDILLRAVRRYLHNSKDKPGAHDRINGLKHVARVIEVDQTPIGRTPRSNPATYTNLFDEIRKLFTALPEAKIRGYKAGRFSFNVKGGRCEACQGQGTKKIAMHFLPDVFVTCESCAGTRYNQDTLEVQYKGKSIADILKMTTENAVDFFASHPKIRKVAQALVDVGLGYLELGQPSTTLSGGEAQRVKLATELAKGGPRGRALEDAHTLYILDEPTTGLHFEDVRKLIEVLQRLADAGHSVLIIEHNLDVIKSADWLIDMGPEGGAGGGTIVAEGTPEDLIHHRDSYTGAYLQDVLPPSHLAQKSS
ncbi:MAG: excinuclease ABC subunit UvrA [Myxococcales bacterium]|nr:excinuclease ABC subunit UvrA [Myxococcales bacterium]